MLKGVTCKLLDWRDQNPLKYFSPKCKKPQARLPSRYLSAYLVKELRFIFTASKVRFPS